MRTAIVITFVVARAAAFVPAPPEVAALRLKETLDERGFVRVPGATFLQCRIQMSRAPASRR